MPLVRYQQQSTTLWVNLPPLIVRAFGRTDGQRLGARSARPRYPGASAAERRMCSHSRRALCFTKTMSFVATPADTAVGFAQIAGGEGTISSAPGRWQPGAFTWGLCSTACSRRTRTGLPKGVTAPSAGRCLAVVRADAWQQACRAVARQRGMRCSFCGKQYPLEIPPVFWLGDRSGESEPTGLAHSPGFYLWVVGLLCRPPIRCLPLPLPSAKDLLRTRSISSRTQAQLVKLFVCATTRADS